MYAMPLSILSDISLDENDSFFEFKYPQDSTFRLRTTHWKISNKDSEISRNVIIQFLKIN
jgi:hypothetical protein